MRTIKSVALFFICLVSLSSVKAQDKTSEPVVFTVNGKQKVYLGEFERQFLKNLNLNEKKVTAKDIDDYLKLYVKFKLKIQDAIDAGKDTVAAYKQELSMYREQLARNYLYDRAVTESLISEAYERLKSQVKVSHILIMCSRDASEADVTKASKRIGEIYQALKRNPTAQNFADYAKTDSDDPGTKNSGGSLGWMTALQVVYEFENQAYNTPVGGISEPFRTDFGYHIVRVEDIRKSPGDVKVKHILIRVGQNSENTDEVAKQKINDILSKIKSKSSTFEDMAKTYSEDFNSRYNGGELDWVNITQFVGDIERQDWISKAYSLKPGEITEPFRTGFGWHLLQLVEKRGLGSYDQMKVQLKNQVQQNQRSQISVDSLITKVKKQENYKLNQVALNYLIQSLDSNFMNGTFKLEMLPKKFIKKEKNEKTKKEVVTEFDFLQMELFNLANESYTVEDFAVRLVNGKKKISGAKKEAVESKLNAWVNDLCVNYQNTHLEEKSVEFRDIYQEYREGILMFNRMQEKVWDKANNDSIGLVEYFKKHNKEYTWNDRFHVEAYYCVDEKMMKQVFKQVKKGIPADSLKRMHTSNGRGRLDFDYRIGKYQSTDTFLFPQKKVLYNIFNTPEYRTAKNKVFKMGLVGNDYVVLKVREFLPAGLKSLDETRGPVASKYQEELEVLWLNELAAKYPVDINQSTVDAFKLKLGAK